MAPAFLSHTPALAAPSTARLNALYASTSAQAASNPEGYEANVKWWTGVLDEVTRVGYLGDRLVLAVGPELGSKLENGGVQPKGLGGVVNSLVPETLHPLPTFLSSEVPIRDPGSLTYRLLGRPLWWAVSKVNPFASGGVEKEESLWKRVNGKDYVYMPLLERSAAQVIERFRDDPPTSYSASLFSPSSFREAYGSIAVPNRSDGKPHLPSGPHSLSEKDTKVLLRWLSRDAGVLSTNGKVIRVLRAGEAVEDHPITEADIGTLTILETISKVEAQVDSLSEQVAECTTDAKKHLSKGQKSQAMSRLKSKKRLEEVLDKRLATLEQLRSVLSSIDTAQGDVEIMSAYETATDTLKGVLANPLLDISRVEKTTDELADAMADQAEVDSAIRVGGQIAVGGEVIDDDELQAELEGLVLEEKEKEKERENKEREREKAKEEKIKAEEEARKEAAKVKLDKAKQQAALEDTSVPDSAWQKTYDLAQERKREEAQRAAEERLRKEAAM